LKWGNADALLKAVELIAHREGFGNFLAEGSARMARKIGHNSIALRCRSKGQETSMHEPRIKANMAYGFMFAPAGADHCSSATDGAISTEKGMGIIIPWVGMRLSFLMKSAPGRWLL